MRAGLNEASFPFLARLTSEGRRELGALRATRARSGQRLLERGDPIDGVYLVVEGSLRVFYVTKGGREATLYHVEPGGTCVLALTASFQGEPYPAWVEAGTKGGSFVRLPSELLRRALDTEPPFRDFVFAVLSGRIFELMSSLEEVQSAEVEERVARYLVRSADTSGTVRRTQTGIASELGTAREVVFRALRSLAERGWVRRARGHIQVLDPTALRALSAR